MYTMESLNYLRLIKFIFVLLINASILVKQTNTSPIDETKLNAADVHNIFSELKKENEALKQYLTLEGKKIAGLTSDVDKLKHEMVELKETVSDITNEMSGGMDEPPTSTLSRRKRGTRRLRISPWRHEVGFQALLTKGTVTYSTDDTIKFDHVITNMGNMRYGYDRESSVFTAPYKGTYMFFFNIVSAGNSHVEASLKVNDHFMLSSVSDPQVNHGSDFNQGSAMVIVMLNVEDKVSVVITGPEAGSHEVSGNGKTSFAGYMLRQRHR